MQLQKNRLFILFTSVFLIRIAYLIVVIGFDFSKEYVLNDFIGDARGYLQVAFDFLKTGTYRFADLNDGITNYLFRMPGMAFILVPLFFLFSFSVAIKFFIVLQIILSTYAYYLLYKLLSEKIPSKWFKVVLLIFIAFGSYFNYYTHKVLTETIASSLFIIIMYYLLKEYKNKVDKKFILICVLTVWLIFLRPFLGAFLPLFLIRLLHPNTFKNGFAAMFKLNKAAIVLVTFFAISIGTWTVRNYIVTKQIVFLEYSSKSEKFHMMRECSPLLTKFIKNFRGNPYTYNSAKSHYMWFAYDSMKYRQQYIVRPSDDIFPKDLFVAGITIDSLERARFLVEQTLKSPKNSDIRKVHLKEFENCVNAMNDKYMADKGMLHWLSVRRGAITSFFYQPLQYENSFAGSATLHKLNNVFNWFLNIIFISGGIILYLLSFFKISILKEQYFLLLPVAFVLYFFIGYMNFIEERELFCYYPAILLAAASVIGSLFPTSKQENN